MYKKFAALFLCYLISCVTVADQNQDLEQIKETIKKLGHDKITINDITPTPIPGIYEVLMGANLAYLSADGRYMLIGDLIDAKNYKNLSATRRSEARTKALNELGEENMFVFAPDKPAKYTVTIFTDIDCGYCRKLHRDIKSYNENSIKIRYLMFPRSGKDSKSYEKAVNTWCANDRNAALTKAKNGEELEHKECSNPIKQHMSLGESMGVTGTPTIITDNGELLPGYAPATTLVQILSDEKRKSYKSIITE